MRKSTLTAAFLPMLVAGCDGLVGIPGLGKDYGTEVRIVHVFEPFSGSWQQSGNVPHTRREASAAALGDTLLFVGGWSWGDEAARTASGVLMILDTNTGAWTEGSRMPATRRAAVAGVIDGRLYVAGGERENGHYLSSVQCYDPATDGWENRARMPTARTLAAGGVIDGRLYVAGGGSTAVGPTSVLEVYDPTTDAWTTAAPMPYAAAGGCAGVIEGCLYVLAGVDSSGSGYRLSVYDPNTDSWQERAGSLGEHESGVAGVVDGRLWVTGSIGGIWDDECEVYDPGTDKWSWTNPMPVARCDAAAAVINGRIWVVGGYHDP